MLIGCTCTGISLTYPASALSTEELWKLCTSKNLLLSIKRDLKPKCLETRLIVEDRTANLRA